MAALPLPVTILDDLIPKPEMRSSKMATGSGRAAIYLRRRYGERKVLTILLLMSTRHFKTRATPFRGWRIGRLLEDVFTGDPTSSRRYFWRHHLGWHHPRWKGQKWRQPRLRDNFSIPIEAAAENGGPFRFRSPSWMTSFWYRKWGHPRWRPEAKGPPFTAAAAMGIDKFSLYYSTVYAFTQIVQSKTVHIFPDILTK